jgi:hypothetical protein
MSISNYLENAILDKVFRATNVTVTTAYVSLHTADPGETGASEATGGSYARQSVAFDAAASGATANTAAINFTLMPAATLTHIGVWDASTAGNFLWGGAASASRTTASGDTYQIPAGDLDITID